MVSGSAKAVRSKARSVQGQSRRQISSLRWWRLSATSWQNFLQHTSEKQSVILKLNDSASCIHSISPFLLKSWFRVQERGSTQPPEDQAELCKEKWHQWATKAYANHRRSPGTVQVITSPVYNVRACPLLKGIRRISRCFFHETRTHATSKNAAKKKCANDMHSSIKSLGQYAQCHRYVCLSKMNYTKFSME